MEVTSVVPVKTKSEYFVVDEWAQILERLTDHDDRWNAAHANPLFRHILQYPIDAWMTTLFYKVLPHLYRYLTSSSVLKLRQLSKSWRDILDQFLESDQRWHDADENSIQKVKLNIFQHPTLTRRERFANLLDEMSTTPQTKIVGGSVFIDDTVDEGGYRQIDFRPFFWRFGYQVYHLTLNMHVSYNASPIQSWKFVLDLLVHTPNLKTLNLDMTIQAQDEENGPWVWYRGLARLFQKRRLPPLNKLKSLTLGQGGWGISTSDEADVPLCQAFVTAYGVHLEKLDISNVYSSIPIPEKLDNLQDLTCSVLCQDELIALKQTNPIKLEKLNMAVCYDAKLLYPMEHVEFLDKFQNLKSLTIHSSFNKPCDLSGSLNPLPNGLCLPNLQKLYLWEYGLTRNPSLQFLLNFPKLRSFYFGWKIVNLYGSQCKENENNIYSIGNYLNHRRLIDKNKFYKVCPVWDFLPYLDLIELEGKVGLEIHRSVCTRQERRCFQKKSKH